MKTLRIIVSQLINLIIIAESSERNRKVSAKSESFLTLVKLLGRKTFSIKETCNYGRGSINHRSTLDSLSNTISCQQTIIRVATTTCIASYSELGKLSCTATSRTHCALDKQQESFPKCLKASFLLVSEQTVVFIISGNSEQE